MTFRYLAAAVAAVVTLAGAPSSAVGSASDDRPGSAIPAPAATVATALDVASPPQAHPGEATVEPGYSGPVDPAIPRPESVLGFRPGADFQLADWSTILEYLRRLDAASDRMTLREIGQSAMGQPLVIALISSPANLSQAQRYRSIAERLTRAHDLTDEEARRLAADGKAVVWIDSGLHATEVAHGQHAPELAYVMVAGESEELRRIRDDVILVLMPNMNPDGLDMVVEWYEENLGTSYETAPLPWLYHKYVGHDNNRDWYMITQPETRAVSRILYHEWYPQIVYNHHQTAPFPARIFVPPFADPSNPNIPPLVLRGIERVGNAITTRLEAEGKVGAISRYTFTTWWNGGMRTVPYYHNMVGILTETALFRYATPNFYPPDALPDKFRNGWSTRQASTNYPSPWPGGWWRLRDAVDYMLTASLATLDVASKYRDDWLYNAYQMGRDAIREGKRGHPAGWAIPPDQHDPAAAIELVNALSRGGLEVRRAEDPFVGDDVSYAAGTYIVPASQAFRNYAIDLLEPQDYPDRRLYPEGPPAPPYDLAGWTLPLQMGVRVDRLAEPFEVATVPVEGVAATTGEVVGTGSTFVIAPTSNAAAAAVNRLLAGGESVYWSDSPVRIGSDRVGPGAVVVAGGPGVDAEVATIAEELGLRVLATQRSPRGEGWVLGKPRVGLYDPWVANMDAGWTRWLLEKYEFEYEVLRDATVRKGGLRRRFDAIVLPSAGLESLVEGHEPGSMPRRYAGGLGDDGVTALRRFVEAGGTLVCLDDAGGLPLEHFGLEAFDALEGLEQEQFYSPGSLLRIRVDATHPVAFGMPEEATAFFVRSNAYGIAEVSPELERKPGDEGVVSLDARAAADALEPGSSGERAVAVATYAQGDLLESGWILGQQYLRGRGAVLEAGLGDGRVVLIGFRSQFRAQPHETFKLLFNSLFYSAAARASLP